MIINSNEQLTNVSLHDFQHSNGAITRIEVHEIFLGKNQHSDNPERFFAFPLSNKYPKNDFTVKGKTAHSVLTSLIDMLKSS